MPPMDYGSFAAQWWQLPWPGANNWNLKLLITRVCQLLCVCHRNICSKLPFLCTASNTCTCTHTRRHGWSHRMTQYREVTRYLALYESLVIWSYEDRMDTVRFPLRVFTSMRTSYKIKIKKENPYPIQSNLILFVLPWTWSHLADMVHECTTLLQPGWAAIKGGATAIDLPIKREKEGPRLYYSESGSLLSAWPV